VLEDCDGNERDQILLVSRDGGEVLRLTHAPDAIHTFGGWSPDGRQIAFGSNRRDPSCFDLYTLDIDSGEERCVLRTEGHFTPVAWSPVGDQLLVQEQRSNSDQDLHLLDLAAASLRCVTAHAGEARYESARFLPDGRAVLLCTDQDRDFLALARLDTKLGRLRPLLERRADVESCDVSADGKRLVALLNRDGWSELLVSRLDERLLRGVVSARLPGVAAGCRIAAGGNRIALSLHGPTTNLNVWSMDPETTARTRWTQAPMGDLERLPLVEPTQVNYLTHDGLEIPALLYRPHGSGNERRPAVVHIHGGPEAQDRPGFSPVYQYLAHRGYVVLAPNVRGSTGYGKAYSHLDDRENRVAALRDVEFAGRWLKSCGFVDPDRIGIMGGSYGGYTVLACLTRQPAMWAAGVDIVGIANFETFFKHTGPWRRRLRAREYGDPVKDAALLRRLSPIHKIDRIRAPLMVVQGANDPRVPQEESDQMVEQLRARSHPVEYLLFADEGHGIVKIPNRIKAYTAIGEFLDRHLMPTCGVGDGNTSTP
jgi:dipeptidyl aminopeptidase/acylaminoacyl peptidase